MTNPWGARVREIMREMERDREGSARDQDRLTRAVHVNTHRPVFPRCSQQLSLLYLWSKHPRPRRNATFMQHEAVVSVGFTSPQRDAGMMHSTLTGAAILTAQFGHQPDKSCLLELQRTQDRAGSVIPTWH
ncbi:uncharacterized protein V6R79_020787 [Siganus canaliculatus]